MANPFSENDRKWTKVRAQITGKLWPSLARRAIGRSGVNNDKW